MTCLYCRANWLTNGPLRCHRCREHVRRCTVDGCRGIHHAGGLCAAHYHRQQYNRRKVARPVRTLAPRSAGEA